MNMHLLRAAWGCRASTARVPGSSGRTLSLAASGSGTIALSECFCHRIFRNGRSDADSKGIRFLPVPLPSQASAPSPNPKAAQPALPLPVSKAPSSLHSTACRSVGTVVGSTSFELARRTCRSSNRPSCHGCPPCETMPSSRRQPAPQFQSASRLPTSNRLPSSIHHRFARGVRLASAASKAAY